MIDCRCALTTESKAWTSFAYTFEPEQQNATLLVLVKFGPGLRDLVFENAPPYLCENFNRAMLDVYDDPQQVPVVTAAEEASAWLKVVEK